MEFKFSTQYKIIYILAGIVSLIAGAFVLLNPFGNHRDLMELSSYGKLFVGISMLSLGLHYWINSFIQIKHTTLIVKPQWFLVKEIALEKVKEVEFNRDKKTLKFDDYTISLTYLRKEERDTFVKTVKAIRLKLTE